MNTAQFKNNAGFTLVETMIALGLLTMVCGTLMFSGIYVMRQTRFNMVSSEARFLGLQKLEEIAAGGSHNIILQTPFAPQTNLIQGTYPVIRTVDVIGHLADQTMSTNLPSCDYLELHVNVMFRSEVSKKAMTNSFSTIVPK